MEDRATAIAQFELTVQIPGEPIRTIPITVGQYVIGRTDDANIVFPQPFLSRRHLILEIQLDRITVQDLGSTNGTKVNRQEIKPFEAVPVQLEDVITIGNEEEHLEFLILRGMTKDDVTKHISEIGTHTQMVETFHLKDEDRFLIGREPDCRIHLAHPAVSRYHAEITQQGDTYYLRDLGSQNGTFVDGQQVRSNAHELENGDVVQVGPFKLLFDDGNLIEFYAKGSYRLDAFDLERTVTIGRNERRTILNHISLSIYPKEFVALVGGSGAGKSTLIKALSGFFPSEGEVLINGDNLYENFGAYRPILGYVPQDDVIHGNLTVQEALIYAAELRLPETNRAEVLEIVDDILESVEMEEHGDKLVKNLSGGQRKRVSIGVELLADPGLFFLDEPTSGLDPGLEKKMMQTLRNLADSGRTVILITHATANIEQCTQVVFLAYGRMVYYGPPKAATEFFGTEDFADIYSTIADEAVEVTFPDQWQGLSQEMIRANPEVTAAEVWEAAYKQTEHYTEFVQERLQEVDEKLGKKQSNRQSNTLRVPGWEQFYYLVQRNWALIRRDYLTLTILLAVMPVIAFLLLFMADNYDFVGRAADDVRRSIQRDISEQWTAAAADSESYFQSVYQIAGSTERVIFIMALAASLLGLFGGAYEIVRENAIYQRERLAGLLILPYLGGKLVILFGFALLQCVLFLLVLGLKLDFPAEGVIFSAPVEMYITLALATLASMCLGLLISALSRTTNSVIYAILVIVFLQIMFAGSIFEIPPAGRFISNATTTKWTLEALGSTIDLEELRNTGGGCLDTDTPVSLVTQVENLYCTDKQIPIDAEYPLKLSFDHTSQFLLSRWGVLFGFALLFFVATGIVQYRKDMI